jgi:LacI family transcriptional regulator
MVARDEGLAGYCLALEEARLPLDGSLIVESMIAYSGGGAAASQLLNLPRPATAALCYNDVVAIGLVRIPTEIEIVVGKDSAVIGFDDIDEATHRPPAFTTVPINGRKLGSRAAQLLMRQLASGNFEPETVPCPTTLIVPASCGSSTSKQPGAHS